MVTDLGVRWVRDSVPWSVMEPSPGHYIDFPADFKSRLDFYKSNYVGVVFMLAYDDWIAYPKNASNPTAAFDAVAFGNFAAEVARQLRNYGVNFVLELWNEPHNNVLLPTLGGNWNGASPSPWVNYYVKMVNEAVTRVKALDSSIRLIDNDDMWIIHYWFLEAGLPSALDGFAFHPYVQGNPEKAACDQNTSWTAPFTVVDADSSFTSAVRRLRSQGQNKLGHIPQMWATEWGWAVNQPNSSGTVFTEDTVAAWLPRAFILAEAAGLENVCWFSTQDNVDGPMGLTTNDGTKRKAYKSFKVLSDTFGDFFYLGQVLGADHQSSGVQAHAFTRGNYIKMAVWDIEPATGWLQLTGQLQSAKVTDSMGNTVAPAVGSNGSNWIPIGMAPVYLDFPMQSTMPSLNVSNSTVVP